MSDFEIAVTPKFKRSRRGYDPTEVDDFVSQLSAKISEFQARIENLEADLKNSLEELEKSQNPDEEALTKILGESVARLLTTAKREADLIRNESVAKAEEIVHTAKRETRDIHDRAEQAFKERIDAAKAEAEKVKEEALSIRQKTLEDLSRRKKEAVTQVERLTAGRDRLINSFETSQKLLNEIKGRVNESLATAKIAANKAARKAEAQAELTPAELEEEIAVAKLLDLPQSIYNPEQSSTKKIPAAAAAAPPVLPNETILVEEKAEEVKKEAVPEISTPNLDRAVQTMTTKQDTTASLFDKLRDEQENEKPPAPKRKPTVKQAPTKKEAPKTKAKIAATKTTTPSTKNQEPPQPADSKIENNTGIIDRLSKSLERQIKYGLAQDQNQILDTLRQARRKKELPPIEEQASAYIEAIDNEELSQVTNRQVSISQEMVVELIINPLRKNLNHCLDNETNTSPMDIQKEIRSSYRNFKQIECSKIAHDIAERILV